MFLSSVHLEGKCLPPMAKKLIFTNIIRNGSECLNMSKILFKKNCGSFGGFGECFSEF